MIARYHRPARRSAGAVSRFLGDTRGSPIIEFVLIAPILVTMVIGAADIGRYVMLNQKLSRTASTLGDLVAREKQLVAADYAGIFAAADQTLTPFEIGDHGLLVLTIAEVESDGTVRITDRQSSPASSTLSGRFGNVSETLTGEPAGLMSNIGDRLIISEVRYEYDAWMLDLLNQDSDLYHVAYFRPRH